MMKKNCVAGPQMLRTGVGGFLLLLFSTAVFFPMTVALAAEPESGVNYPGRKAIVLDLSPYLMITNFSFENFVREEGKNRTEGHRFRYQWANTGTQPIVAFEVVTLLYDPFDEPLPGFRRTVGGHNRGDFSPLVPGESSQDVVTGPGHSHIYTAISYVRTVRLSDGRIWRVNESVLARELLRRVPNLEKLGPLVPEKIQEGAIKN